MSSVDAIQVNVPAANDSINLLVSPGTRVVEETNSPGSLRAGFKQLLGENGGQNLREKKTNTTSNSPSATASGSAEELANDTAVNQVSTHLADEKKHTVEQLLTDVLAIDNDLPDENLAEQTSDLINETNAIQQAQISQDFITAEVTIDDVEVTDASTVLTNPTMATEPNVPAVSAIVDKLGLEAMVPGDETELDANRSTIVGSGNNAQLVPPGSGSVELARQVDALTLPSRVNFANPEQAASAIEKQEMPGLVDDSEKKTNATVTKPIINSGIAVLEKPAVNRVSRAVNNSTINAIIGNDTSTSSNISSNEMVTVSRQLTSVDAPPLKSAVTNNVPHMLNNTIRMMLGRDVSSATVNLTPPDLGNMRINIEMKSDQLQVQIIAAQPAARDSIESSLPRLREQLEAEGYEGVFIDFGGGGTQDSNSERAKNSNVPADYLPEIERLPEGLMEGQITQFAGNNRNLIDIFA